MVRSSGLIYMAMNEVFIVGRITGLLRYFRDSADSEFRSKVATILSEHYQKEAESCAEKAQSGEGFAQLMEDYAQTNREKSEEMRRYIPVREKIETDEQLDETLQQIANLLFQCANYARGPQREYVYSAERAVDAAKRYSSKPFIRRDK